MADINGWISSVKIENNAVVTLKDQFPNPHEYTMDVTQGGLTQSITWHDGSFDIDDDVIAADKTWSSEKISGLESPPEVNIGDTTPADDEKLWVDLNGIDPVEVAVRYDINQVLTDDEKARARANIGAGAGEEEVTISATEPVLPNRTDIWIDTAGGDADETCVSFAVNQNLTADEKARACNNIDCVPRAEYEALLERFEALLVKLGIDNM